MSTKSRTGRSFGSRLLAAIAASFVVWASSAAALANTPAQAAPGEVIEALGDVRTTGSGRLRWLGLHVYDARLWLPGPAASASRAPKALELTYGRRFEGTSIASRSVEEIARLGRGSDPQRSAWERAMRAVFPDVAAGDRLLGIHRRDGSVAFFHNGRAIGTIDEPGFADAFFAIWLDPKTTAPQLRAQLLGLDGPDAESAAGTTR